MMNNLRKVAAGLVVVLLALSLWSSAGRSQEQRGHAVDGSSAGTVKGVRQKPLAKTGGMSAEEKLVRDVYARLMRYQSAAVDERLADTAGKPSDYLTFELRNIRSGALADIMERPLAEMVTAHSEAMISLKQVHLSEKNAPPHAYYEAAWTTAPPSKEQPNAVVRDIPGVTDFDSYTSYQVRVHLQGKQVSYRALVLYRQTEGDRQQPAGRAAHVKILDNVTGDMNTVYSDESPRVRSPWKKYVKTSLYFAVTRALTEARAVGQSLIPADAPIGYLPGDDVQPDQSDPLAASDVPRPLAEVTAVNYIEHVVAPWNANWGAMRETTWTVDIDVRFDCPHNRWTAVVSKADSEYEIFYRLLAGVSEASVASATAANHCKMISDLNALGNVAGVQWYMVSAVEAHERVHVGEWRSSLNPEFTNMKTTIEGLSVPNTAGMTAGDAKTQIKAMAAYTNAVTNAFQHARTTFYAIADPNAQTDAAEHGVVDPMIQSIRAAATSNGWAACPP